MCLPKKFAAASASLLGANDESIQMAIDDMIAIRRLKYSVFDGVTYLYDSYAYDCETYIAQKLDLLDKICPSVDVADANLFIEREQSKVGFE